MAKPETQANRVYRAIRIDEEDVRAMLDRLDEGSDSAGADRRGSARYSYRVQGLLVKVRQPGDSSPTAFLVPTRNLSDGGVAFLHGSYVHCGSECSVQLLTTHGARQEARGTVVGCRLVEGGVHEVRVKFDDSVDVSAFTPAALGARVLVVEDEVVMAKLLAHYLRQLNAEVDLAANGQEAMEKTLRASYDLILMDLTMPVMDGLAATRALRARGYSGPIVTVSAQGDSAVAEHALAAGCDRHLPKPIKPEHLSELLASLREEVLMSTLGDDPTLLELADQFVRELPAALMRIEHALRGEDAGELLRLCRGLKANGASFGFLPITERATSVEKALAEGRHPVDVAPVVRDLMKLCRNARVRNQPNERKPWRPSPTPAPEPQPVPPSERIAVDATSLGADLLAAPASSPATVVKVAAKPPQVAPGK
ncbi:MAG TPA: response regulator [Phycisphaerae bacterium]|nr:response regulator [Phycisphaerae bacterium]HNU44658.1 response regulator [Phycisphaerae bacterium]